MYTKKVWAQGDTVTETAINNIENGIPSLPTPELGKRLQVLLDENTMEDLVLIPETSITISNGEEADISDLLDYMTFNDLLISQYQNNFTLTVGNESDTPDVTGSNRIDLEGSQYDYTVGLSYGGGATKVVNSPTIPNGAYFGAYDSNGDVVNGTYTVSLSISLPKAYWGIEQEQEQYALDPTSPSEQEER